MQLDGIRSTAQIKLRELSREGVTFAMTNAIQDFGPEDKFYIPLPEQYGVAIPHTYDFTERAQALARKALQEAFNRNRGALKCSPGSCTLNREALCDQRSVRFCWAREKTKSEFEYDLIQCDGVELRAHKTCFIAQAKKFQWRLSRGFMANYMVSGEAATGLSSTCTNGWLRESTSIFPARPTP